MPRYYYSFLILTTLASLASSQLQCTFTASDESSCVEATADGGNHCVWCALSTFGFCVSETQAEAMEEQIPGIHCDRYSGDDDDSVQPADDDDANIVPNDDALPDDFWQCLQNKDAASCSTADDCTWCDTKGGFGLCMNGPTAESAKESDWFTCSEEQADLTMTTPYDPTCLAVSLLSNDSDKQSTCQQTADMTGNPCEWCNLAGGDYPLCLTTEQADMGQAYGLACDTGSSNHQQVQDVDPYDPSCAMAYLQDQSKEACLAAVDEDGNACEYCTLQGALNLCLTEEQAEYGQALGIECETSTTASSASQHLRTSHQDAVQDPTDTTCALVYVQDPSKEACVAAVDQDGRVCEWCELPGGMGDLCLNEDQAEMATQFGVTCSSSIISTSA